MSPSPHSEHADQALLAIEAGKHVLVEKAFARNAKEARRVVVAARRRQVAVMEAMWTRFLPRTDIVRQLLADGTPGRSRPSRPTTASGSPSTRGRWLETRSSPAAPCSTSASTRSPSRRSCSAFPGAVVATGELTPTGVDRQVAALLTRFANHPHAQALVSCTLAAKTPTTATITGSLARVELDAEFYAPGRVRLESPSGEPP